jgi:hypothetical protein
MNNRQLAAALGLSPHTTKKYSPEKRAALIREIEAGVNPEVKRLIGELAQLCYVVSCKTGAECSTEFFRTFFNVWHTGEYIIYDAELNALALQGAIAKLEELIK